MITKPAEISVVICAYSLERWDDLVKAINSVVKQTTPPHEIVVVIDHNTALLEWVWDVFPNVLAVENQETKGLSGARNTGITVSTGSLVAFLDDDAYADPDWLARLSVHFQDRQVLGVGGAIEPLWEHQAKWFPAEFQWVVGCTYRGMPTTTAPVRNLIGASMCIRRDVFDAVGGFRSEIGRVGTLPLGCEETELCIRAHQYRPSSRFVYEPSAVVHHHVPARRTTFRYFSSRCYAEGLSKAMVSRLVGAADGLASERAYTTRVLPLGVMKGLRDVVTHADLSGVGRAAAIVAGLFITGVGYLNGTRHLRSSSAPPIATTPSAVPSKP